MRKNILKLSALLISASVSYSCFADLSSDIVECSTIDDNNKRLQCFDFTAKKYHVNPAKEGVVDLTQTKTDTAAVKVMLSPPNKAEKITSKLSRGDAFGKENKTGLQQIESRIEGKFNGWKKGMKLHLENGQSWKVVSQNSGYKPMSNPKIVISRGVFGSFDAKVEGLNARAKVRRLK